MRIFHHRTAPVSQLHNPMTGWLASWLADWLVGWQQFQRLGVSARPRNFSFPSLKYEWIDLNESKICCWKQINRQRIRVLRPHKREAHPSVCVCARFVHNAQHFQLNTVHERIVEWKSLTITLSVIGFCCDIDQFSFTNSIQSVCPCACLCCPSPRVCVSKQNWEINFLLFSLWTEYVVKCTMYEVREGGVSRIRSEVLAHLWLI